MRIAKLSIVLGLLLSTATAGDIVRDSPPNRWLNDLLPEALPPLEVPAYYTTLERARLESFRGRYRKSLLTLKELKEGDPVEIATIRARNLWLIGKSEQALASLAAEDVRADERATVLRAEILADIGRKSDAVAALEALIKVRPGSIAARALLARTLEQMGDLQRAKAEYAWFVADEQDFLNRFRHDPENAFNSAEELTLIASALDRWATLHGEYRKIPQLPDTILAMFTRAHDIVDRTYWPARRDSALYLRLHDNDEDALKELAAVMKENPQDVTTLVTLGAIMLDRFDFDRAEAAVEAIRAFNPDSIAADLLEARSFLRQRLPAAAEPRIARVLKSQPENLEALGLLAAVQALQLREKEMSQTLAKVEKLDPDNASAYFEVAEQLGAMRQYPRSAQMYQVAIERAPWFTAARNGLGLLYTQSGDDDLARATLNAAREFDPYNLRTTNYMRLLDRLEAFQRRESENFIITFDRDEDPILADYFIEYLESIHAQITDAFQHTPAVKTIIEIYPKHDQFSVRTTGSPWIGTVGASTGRVIALVAPRKGESTLGAFNWAQVLRHEYVHTVTLSATENRIPHWMTEGLAVYEERTPLRWEWVPMLYYAVTKNELFTMDELTWGFVRPRRPNDRQLAYAQSFWVCTYIADKWGWDTILKMMEQFRLGKSEREVFQSVLGKSQPEFTTEFFSWCREQVSGWGYDEETTRQYNDLRARGEQLIQQRKFADAIETWEQIRKIRPVDPLPHQRLAGLYLNASVNQPLKAVERLRSLHETELKDNRYAKRIARIYRDNGDFRTSAHWAMQAVYIDPYDLDAHQLMAEMYEKTGNEKGLQRERAVIAELMKWNDRRKNSQTSGAN